jgi:hypothetical protein
MIYLQCHFMCTYTFKMHSQLELIEHIPRVLWCIASATDGRFNLGEIEFTQDSLVQACTVVTIGVSDICVAIYDGHQKGTICDACGSYPSI